LDVEEFFDEDGVAAKVAMGAGFAKLGYGFVTFYAAHSVVVSP
jgi:hypothetical protein